MFGKALLAIAIFGIWNGTATGADDRRAAATRHGQVVTTATVDTIDTQSLLPGLVEPVQQVTLSVPVAGVLRQVLVAEGQIVQEGQLLAQMDQRIAAAELELAQRMTHREGAVATATAHLAMAENLLDRLMSVKDRRAVSELEVAKAASDRDAALAALQAAREQASESQANRQLAEARLENHNIRAPFSGQVLRIDAQAGATMTNVTPVITLANLDQLRVELYLPLAWFGHLNLNQEYPLAAAAPVNRPISARLVAFEPVIASATQTFRCSFEIDNSDGVLPSGFAVHWTLQPDAKAPATH